MTGRHRKAVVRTALIAVVALFIAAAGGGYLLISGFQKQGATAPAAVRELGRHEPVETEAVPAHSVELRTVQIPVDGMTCAVCTSRVRRAMIGIEGVVDAEVDLAQRHAVVRYDEGQVTAEQLAEQINGMGYRAGMPEAK